MTLPHDVSVKAYHGWSDDDPVVTRYSSLADALDAARALGRSDYPIVDVIIRGLGVVAGRRLVAHPSDGSFSPVDTIGGTA